MGKLCQQRMAKCVLDKADGPALVCQVGGQLLLPGAVVRRQVVETLLHQAVLQQGGARGVLLLSSLNRGRCEPLSHRDQPVKQVHEVKKGLDGELNPARTVSLLTGHLARCCPTRQPVCFWMVRVFSHLSLFYITRLW